MQTNQQPSILRHDVDFDNAILFQKPVSVWRNGKCVEHCGMVERFTPTSAIISKSLNSNCYSYYLREYTEFRVE